MQINDSKQLPPGINFLFLTQALSNFGFYGIKSIFLIYALRQLSLTESEAVALFATYMSLCYATSLIGGTIADRLLGIKNTVLLGGFLCFSGLLLFVFPFQDACFIGLSLMSLGSGFFKPNLSTAVGLFFENPKDDQKSKAYSLFYVAINIGNFLASIIAGFVCAKYGWNYGILLIASTFLILTYVFHQKIHFKDQKELATQISPLSIIFLLICLLFTLPVLYFLMKYRGSIHGLMGIISIGSIFYLGLIYTRCNTQERKDVFRIIICILLFSFFGSLYEQAGSSLVLFYEKAVDRNFMGSEIPSSAFLSLNPLFVLILTPIFLYLSKGYLERTHPLDDFVKIGLGFIFASSEFLVFAISTYQSIFPVSPWWVVTAMLLKAIGELIFVPTVLAVISKYAPLPFRSVMMSFWLMAIAYSHYVGGIIAQFSLQSPTEQSITGLDQYFSFFTSLSLMAFGIPVLLFSYRGIRKLFRR